MSARTTRRVCRRGILYVEDITPQHFQEEGFNAQRAADKANEVRNGAQLMQHNAVFPEVRPCRDAVWAVLFCIVGGAMLVATGYFVGELSRQPVIISAGNRHEAMSSSSVEEPMDEDMFGIAASRLLQASEAAAPSQDVTVGLLLAVFLVPAAIGIVAAYPFIVLAHKFTSTVVHVALLLGPISMIVSGVSMVMAALGAGGAAGAMLVLGFLCILFGALGLFCIWCAWGRLIPFTIRVTKLVAGVARQFPSLLLAPIFGSFVGSVWVLLALMVVAGASVQSGDKLQEADRSELYGVLFVVALVLSWGTLVAANVAHVAICGVFGRWYFDKHRGVSKAGVVMASLRVALGPSLGSVCFGSLLVAGIQATRIVVNQMRQDARRDGNQVLACLLCLVQSILRCIGDILEYFNEWAYVQCAIRGLNFIQSAKVTFSLCTCGNIRYIMSDLLIGYVVALGSLICGVVGGATGAIIGGGGAGTNGVLVGSVLGFVVAVGTGGTAMSVFSSGAKAILSCWAESPGTLRNKSEEEAPGAAGVADEFEQGPRSSDY